MLCCVVLCCVVLCCVVLCCVAFCVVLRVVLRWSVALCCVVLFCVWLGCVLCCVALRCVVLRCVVLCCFFPNLAFFQTHPYFQNCFPNLENHPYFQNCFFKIWGNISLFAVKFSDLVLGRPRRLPRTAGWGSGGAGARAACPD